MVKLSFNLPKYRLQLHFKMIKRRKGFVEETILPELEELKKAKKANRKSKISYLFRYIFEHRNIRKILGGNLALMIVASSFFPAKTILAQNTDTANEVVSVAQAPIETERGVQLPIDHFYISQGFSFFHPGIDMADSYNESVKPIMVGKVIEIERSHFDYGNEVIIDHGNQISSLYAHLSEIDVQLGQEITTQSIIGKVGSTGHSTGPHLHLEVHDHGIPINPLSVLPLP